MASPAYEWATRSSPLYRRNSPAAARLSSPAAGSSPVPDTNSPVYPDRLIRPLPKRRLRDRLSLEENESLAFPSVPSSNTSLFSFPYVAATRTTSTTEPARQVRGESLQQDETCETCHHEQAEVGTGDKEVEKSRSVHVSPERPRGGRTIAATGRKWTKAGPPPGSAASSVDGYESFENTNNKKKRKIPQSNGLGGHHAGLSADLANLGISTKEGDTTAGASRRVGDEVERTVGSYYGTGTSVSGTSTGVGLSGPGRGRYSRSVRGSSDRRPLGTSTNGVNAYNAGSGRTRASLNSLKESPRASPTIAGAEAEAGQRGIISTAIASAKQQPSPQTPKGADTTILREQASKSPPQKTDFTFTCGSESTSKVVWPGQQTASHMTQSPNASHRGMGSAPPLNSATPHAQAQQPQGNPAQAKKPRPRRPGRVYEQAAHDRRMQQEYANYHHPPRREDIWICEFCEYEAIFGTPPLALIRQYEKKDLKEQKKQEEKRRLLEKAKMKGRKGKKGTKATKAAQHAAEFQKREMQRADAARQHQAAVGGNRQTHPPSDAQQQELYDETRDREEEEYYEDEYGDTFDMPELVPAFDYPPLNPDRLHAQVSHRPSVPDASRGKAGKGLSMPSSRAPPGVPPGQAAARS